jgi:parallel beta-helix repeat protein
MKRLRKRLALVLVILFLIPLISLPPANSQSQPKQITITSDGSVIGTDSIVKKGALYTLTENLNASILILKDNIIIDGAGFALHGSGRVINDGISPLLYYGPEKETAVMMNGRSNVTIENLNITGFGIGIALYGCSYCILSDNRFSGINGYPGVIYLNNSANNWITKNEIETFPQNAISVWDSSNNVISRNLVQNSSGGGISVGGLNNMIAANSVRNTPIGISVSSAYNSIIGNNITRHSVAILLLEANETTISKNYISRCQISFDNNLLGNNNSIFENEFVNNQCIVENAQTLFFYKNNFIDTYPAPLRNAIHSSYQTENLTSHTWDNGVTGNYWSDYKIKYHNAKEIWGTGTYDTAYYVSAQPASLNSYAYQDYYPLVNPVTFSQNMTDTPSWLLNPQLIKQTQFPEEVIFLAIVIVVAILTSAVLLLLYVRHRKTSDINQ